MNWLGILLKCGVKPATANLWATAFASEIPTEDRFSAGKRELPDFLGQILHESAMLEHVEENLNYSVGRLCVVWPKRFPTPEAAQPYAHNPVALANKVYAGRMGNTEPGDGWKYRGRTPIMVTGKDNYIALSPVIGEDLEKSPDLLGQPKIAVKAMVKWWESQIPDSIIGNSSLISRKVNGGTVGLEERDKLTAKAREALV